MSASPVHEELLPRLQWLERVLARAFSGMQKGDTKAVADPCCGFYLAVACDVAAIRSVAGAETHDG